MNVSPEGLFLDRIEWDLFATLTWSHSMVRSYHGMSRSFGPIRRERLFFAFLRTWCRDVGEPFKTLRWCRRFEVGELGRPHWHLLVASEKPESRTVGSRMTFIAAWNRFTADSERKEGYFARVRRLSSASKAQAIQYACKDFCPDAYELGRFGSDLVLSPKALEDLIRARRAEKGRGLAV